ncbi:MAG: uroporphyrinogen-III C-methyltransferase [Rubrivivax sp.]|nr:uroporphyrinogen-III C-methyltransferase [Rubrivivax sp.]
MALALVAVVLAAVAWMQTWTTQQRTRALEAELVKRQQDSSVQATEARTLAREADQTAREAAAKMALLEARVAETSMQRTQLEDLLQSLARSRDENVLADVDAAIRVAMQQSAITGSAEPLILALRQAEERLARYAQPRLERVRRALAQDLERTRTAGVTDVTVLTIRLDEVVRQVDDLPLQAIVDRRQLQRGAGAATAPTPAAATAAAAAPAAPASAASAAAATPSWTERLAAQWRAFGGHVWDEVRALVRVSRIDQPEVMLIAPDQAVFLRENLKLRLLNARLAILSRQFDTAQTDLRDAQAALDRYFDRSSRRVVAASETVRQVMAQARLVTVPRPDATLAAIAAATGGR